MSRMFSLLMAAFLCLAARAEADPPQTAQMLQMITNNVPVRAAAFTGLCDQVTCKAYWGLRAATASARGANAIHICHSDLTTCADWATDATTGNLNVNQAGSGVTDCNNSTQVCYITKFYDQIGSCLLGAFGSTVSVTAHLTLSDFGTLPGISTNAGGSSMRYETSCTGLGTSQPYTAAAEAKRTANFSTTGVLVNDTGGNEQVIAYSTANNVYITLNGSGQNFTVSDSTLHSLIMIANGASSSLTLDGTTTTVSSTPGSASFGNDLTAFDYNAGGGFQFQGESGEIAFIQSAPNSTTLTNMCHNMRLYWGSGGSC